MDFQAAAMLRLRPFFAIRGMRGVSWCINFLWDRMGVCLVLMGVGGVKQTFPSFHGALAGVWYFRRGGEWGNGKAGIRTNWRRAEQAADLSGKSALIYV